jgi:integrase
VGRPELHRLLDQLRKGDVLVVWKLDLLSRSLVDVLTIMGAAGRSQSWSSQYARKTRLVDKLGPHDLRRTCAKLCRAAGGDLEQIQFLLGHASIQTTERYLGSRQNLKEAVNDRLGLA